MGKYTDIAIAGAVVLIGYLLYEGYSAAKDSVKNAANTANDWIDQRDWQQQREQVISDAGKGAVAGASLGVTGAQMISPNTSVDAVQEEQFANDALNKMLANGADTDIKNQMNPSTNWVSSREGGGLG